MRRATRRVRVLVVQHEDDAPAAWLGTWLVEAGAELDVRRPYAGEPLPADLAEHDAMVVLGGEMGAGDDQHWWIAPTRALVVEAEDRGVATLGVCLGHQLCAVALGGSVVRNPRGQQLGLTAVGWSPETRQDPLLATLVGTTLGVHWNNDVVDALPVDAVVLARSPGGEVQAARLGTCVWGLQLHPEVDEALVTTWAVGDRAVHGDVAVDAALAAIGEARDELLEGWRPLAFSLVALALPLADRRAH